MRENEKQVVIELDKKLWTRARIAALLGGKTLNSFIREL